ncbi:MAG: hypothetical protein QM723_39455 [Myxococcaceae bacterium]
MAIEEPKGPRVCVLAGKWPAAGAQIVAAGFDGTADEGGCVDLPPPLATTFTVCARAPRGSACTRSTRTTAGGWLPVTLLLESAGKLRVEVGNLRGHPVAAAVHASYGDASFTEQTSVNGVALFERMPVGDVRVTVEAKGFLNESGRYARIPRSDLARVRFALSPSSALSGVVIDSTGSGVDWQKLEAVSAIDNVIHAAAHRGDAGFTFDDLPEGPYDLRAEANGFARVAVAVTAPAEKVKLVLEPGYQMEVTVLAPNGSPLEGAEVGTALPNQTIRTDAHGTARLEHLPARALDLLVTPPEGHRCSASMTLSVTPGPDQPKVSAQFATGKEISGTLVSAKGDAVAGEVWAVGSDVRWLDGASALGSFAARIETANGRFTLGCLRDGTYRVGARSKGTFASHQKEVTQDGVAAGTHDLKLHVSTGASAKGRVVDASGRPLENFTLDHSELEAAGGIFETEVQPGKTDTVKVSAKGYQSRLIPVDAVDGQVVDLGVIRLAKTSLARVTVLDRVTRLGIDGASVASLADGGVELDAVLTDGRGEAMVPWTGNPLVVRVHHNEYPALETSIDPTAPSTLELDPGASAHGRVIDRHGDSMYDVKLLARHGELTRFAEIGADGTFTLRGLVPGEWTFNACPARHDRWKPLGVDPAKVEIAAGATTEVNLSERRTGADLTVETGTENTVIHLTGVLLSGAVVCPATATELFELQRAAAYAGTQVRGAYLFAGVPAGDYTFLLSNSDQLLGDPVVLCHAEPIRVSGDGLMRWTAHPRPVTLRAE